MTNAEALEILRFVEGEVYDQVFYDYNAYEFEKEDYDALEIAIDALEKQMPIRGE